MKLIKEIDRRRLKNGKPQRMGIFECPRCLCKVEKPYHGGLVYKNCGCGRDHNGSKNPRFKHGACGTRLYSTWAGIIRRCENRKDRFFYLYGGRGIRMCDAWRNDFTVFRDWALHNGYRDNFLIHRRDHSGNYEPENCEWLSVRESGRIRAGIKITMAIARLIRRASEAGFTRKQIASQFSVSWALVTRVLKNQSWQE